MQQAVAQIKIKAMQKVLAGGFLVMGVKVLAYFITHSNAVLTDALESVINIIAGAFALFSMFYALKPKDSDHPYGHGKIELLSAGFEGGLIFFTGAAIIIKSVYAFFNPVAIHSLDLAVVLASAAGAINFLMGRYLVNLGKLHHSVIMIADGKHLISDTISSAGLVLGLIMIKLTGLLWLDNLIAIIFGGFIFFTGFKLIRQSVTGLLDEADYEHLQQLVAVLDQHRNEQWIDIHNLRVLKYGHTLHVDAHMTLPWYNNLETTHREVAAVELLVKEKIHEEIELFIHADPCIEASCKVCSIDSCLHRKYSLVKKIPWTLDNMLPNQKHVI